MNKYINGNQTIEATEKAYNIIYKKQGYVPYIEEQKEEGCSVADKTVEQLKEIALEKDIEVPSKIKKDDLIKLLEGVE